MRSSKQSGGLWLATSPPCSSKTGDWWIGYVEELAGAHTQGRTLDEAKENLKEAVALILDANREIAETKHD